MNDEDRHLIERIADDIFQRRIEAERTFIASTFKTALTIAGVALSAVLGIFGFLGWQRFDDVQTEAREHAQKEVQKYIAGEAALKDARTELDRQYGEALVRTLRARPRDFDAELDVSRAQIDRLLQVLLSPETSADLFEETAQLIASVGRDHDADWFPRMQDRLIQEGVLKAEYIDIFPERRDRVVWLLSEIGTKNAAKTLRKLLNEQHLSSECARAVFDFERRIQLESPLEKSVLLGYTQRRGPDELVASARALALASYPTEKDFQDWMAPLKDIRDDQRNLLALTVRNVMHDSFGGASWSSPASPFRGETLGILRRVTGECAYIQLALDDHAEPSEAGPLAPSATVSVSCIGAASDEAPAWDFTIAAGTFARFVAADLREALTAGPHDLASAIDRWSSREPSDIRMTLLASSRLRPASITLSGKTVLTSSRPRSVIALTTVPDPSNAEKRLPAFMPSSPDAAPVAFDAMEGFSMHVQLQRADQTVATHDVAPRPATSGIGSAPY